MRELLRYKLFRYIILWLGLFIFLCVISVAIHWDEFADSLRLYFQSLITQIITGIVLIAIFLSIFGSGRSGRGRW